MPLLRGLCSEHKDVGVFAFEEIKKLKMPEAYKRSIQKWSKIFAR
ncbi:hypothetical protein [Nostoc sp. NMS8]|nr:hypothetical protein [Nostoc sp. NMS8]